jgi:Phage capsid protein
MAIGLSAVQQIEFDESVKLAYQSAGMLRKHVREKKGCIGATHRFRRSGRGVAQPRVPQTDVSPMNTTYTEATATLADWHAAEYTDKLDQALVNFDERQIVANNIGSAIGRRLDQMIIDAMDAAIGSPTIPLNASGLTDAKMRRAMQIFDARAVPMGDRKMVISARGKEDLIAEQRFTSRDFVAEYVVREGKLPRLYGFDIEVIDDRDEGGLPLVSTTRTCFAFDKWAVGLAIGAEIPLEVTYVAEKTSWLSNQLIKAGAVAIDALGVIEIATQEA